MMPGDTRQRRAHYPSVVHGSRTIIPPTLWRLFSCSKTAEQSKELSERIVIPKIPWWPIGASGPTLLS